MRRSNTSMVARAAGLLAFALAAACVLGGGSAQASMDSVVYTMDNQFENKIYAWRHGESDEELRFEGSYNTGGSGFIYRSTGAPTNVLGSSIQILEHNGFIFNVNAGSNSVSSFKIREDGRLVLRGVFPTEGVFPVGLASLGRRLCVASAVSPPSSPQPGGYVECYRIRRTGSLLRDYAFENGVLQTLPISGDDFYFGTPGGAEEPENNGPINPARTVAQIGFTPEGDALVAVVKSTGVFVFPIVDDRLSAPKIFTNQQFASGARIPSNPFGDAAGIPFSFVFKTGPEGQRYFIITEAIGVDGTHPLTGGGVSTFRIDPSADVPLVQIDDVVTRGNSPLLTPCWIADYENFLYTTNTAEGTIQTFTLNDRNGRLKVDGPRTRLPRGQEAIDPVIDAANGKGLDTPRGTLPLDLAVSGDCFGKRFLYVVDGGFHRLVTYEIDETTGDLDRLGGRASGVYPIENLDLSPIAQDRQVSGPAVHGVASVCLPSRQ